ncbi:preprotein translocase subunit SecE [Herbivorax sp. ANBcel31]|uniref:preprotein translocase subunit SecE n=1 Tax=Herbivorax sp. ANBcel31 TaxID=3069754 RepID=UPI0027AE94C1|nr:preprotein translocase subunit SecE [Herbivorax sp. ANBcel31]MDQ2086693.1 preprotein translocase subunit SecE [Herbivorax sp. ANBcel31]
MAGNAKKPKAEGTKARFLKFFKEVRSELKKVIWPTKTQLMNNTLTVLIMCLIIGAFIWGLDYGLNILRGLVYA